MLSIDLDKATDCAYTVEGRGEPLILIHGIGAARDAWRLLTPVLEQHFTVVTYDLRGHGLSPLHYGEFGLDELVADLEKLRQTLGYEKVHLAGHSLGGMIGPRYALCFPERVISLGLLSTAAGKNEDDSAKVWGVVKDMEEQGIENILGTLTNRWFTDAFMEQRPDLVERRLQQVISTNAEVFMNVFRIYAGTEMMSWLHEVKHPSLVITGEFDGGCNPRLNKLIDQALPNSQLIILPGLKHSILAEAGDQIAQKMIGFLKSLT